MFVPSSMLAVNQYSKINSRSWRILRRCSLNISQFAGLFKKVFKKEANMPPNR